MSDQAFVEPPIIDTHAHIFVRGLPLAENAWTRPQYDYSAENYVDDLDAHGISFGVIAAASLFDDYNDYTLKALRKYARLRATVRLDPDVDPYTLARLAGEGVVGVRLQWKRGAEPDLRTYRYRRFLMRLADLGLHVELNASGPRLADLLPAIEDAGARTVIDHFGLLRAQDGLEGEGFAALARAVERGSTWVKLSASFRIDAERIQPYAEAILRIAGPDRVFWGSDAPFVGHEGELTYGDTVAAFRAMVPDAATRRAISDSALRFYFF